MTVPLQNIQDLHLFLNIRPCLFTDGNGTGEGHHSELVLQHGKHVLLRKAVFRQIMYQFQCLEAVEPDVELLS